MQTARKGGSTSSGSSGPTTSRRGETVEQDHHIHGLTANIPVTTLLTFAACAIFWWIFNNLQLAATEQAVLHFLQSTAIVAPGMTTAQIKALMDGTSQHDMTIATAIGWAVQLQILLLAFPVDRALLASHRRDATPISPSISRKAVQMAKVMKFLAAVLVAADVITDVMYVLEGHTLVPGTPLLGFIPMLSSTSFGVIIIALIYPLAICSITIFFGIQAAHRLEILVDCFVAAWKNRNAGTAA